MLFLEDETPDSFSKLIQKIIELDNDDTKYLEFVNRPNFTNLNLEYWNKNYTIESIAKKMDNVNFSSIGKKKMNIAFWDNSLCERGTTVSLYDYAYYNQTILKNNSFIFYDKNNANNKQVIIDKFNQHFVVHGTEDFNQVDDYIEKYNITHIYIIKGGEQDNRISKKAINCIHCVFTCSQPHGQIYSSISPIVTGNNGNYPVVPHMINLPDHTNTMRKLLNIPENAVVFGGYGGKEQFDISFVHKVVYTIALNNPNIYFLFANFNEFCPKLNNIIFLPMITELEEKVTFINTTDAMLWARTDGETFGISIGEFSSKNKPVIACKIGNLNHVTILGDKAIWYTHEYDLYNILINFNPKVESKKDWNAYKEYTPEKVMKKFKEVFIDPLET
jgi:hypothetical protein